MKIVTLKEIEFENFASKHKYSNYYQTVNYAKLMKEEGYDYHIVGFLNNSNEIIGASILLYKKCFMNYKMAYAPFGFLIDYTNSDLIDELTDRLKKLLIKQKFMYLKINPLIKCSERDKEGNIIAYNPEINNILEILQRNDYLHKGFNNFFENEKPRWNAVVKLNNTDEKIYENFNKQTHNKISKATRSGVEMIKGTEEDLKTFYEFVKKKHNHTLKYYKNMFKNFSDDITLYLAKINPEEYVKNSDNAYQKETILNDMYNQKLQKLSRTSSDITKILNKKMESDKNLSIHQNDFIKASKLMSENPDGIIIGGMLVIKHKKTATVVIEGFNEEYKSFNPNYLLKWEIIKELKEKEFEILNLNGIVGEFKEKNRYTGLNEMKLGFSSNIVEYIGEFDLIINKPIYNVYQSKLEKEKNL